MPKQNNASYENCISELHSRYDARGVKTSAEREAKGQIKKEMSAPNAYLISRMNRSSVSENYRNGEYNGQKYMTTGDFLKYYNNRKDRNSLYRVPAQPIEKAKTKEFKAPTQRPVENVAEPAARVQAPQRPAARPDAKVRRYDPAAKTIEMPSVVTQKGVRAKVNKIVNKWFPREDKKENTTSFKRDVPVAAIALIVSSTIAMTMIIGSTVMASQANMKVSDLKYDIDYLEEESIMLEEKLMKKEDLAEIKEYAEDNLGMISKDYVAAEYISISSEESAKSYGDEEKSMVDFSTLLSAIFGE